MLRAQALGAERGGPSARPHCGRRRRRAGLRSLPPLRAQRAAGLAILAPWLNLGPKMAGTGKKGARFPVPSVPHPGAGLQPGAAPRLPGALRGGPPNPQRQRPVYTGSSEAPALSVRRETGSGGLPQPRQRGLQCLGSRPGEAGGGPGYAGTEMPGLPRAPEGSWRIPALGSPQLRAPWRAPGAAGGREDAGDPDPRSTADAGGAHRSGGAAEREAAGRLLLPGRRMKPVWFGQVVARRAWRRSGPPRLRAAGSSGSPTPSRPPPLCDLPPASPLRVPATLAAGRDLARLDRSAKMCSANPAVGADTWCRGALCCWRGMFSPGRLFKEKPDSVLPCGWPGSQLANLLWVLYVNSLLRRDAF